MTKSWELNLAQFIKANGHKKALDNIRSRYDYDKKGELPYIKGTIEMEVYCNDHGFFKIAPREHIKGVDCKKCFLARHHKSLEQFIKEAMEVHKEALTPEGEFKYVYIGGPIPYASAIEKFSIYCKICEDYFLQAPHEHLRGSTYNLGCGFKKYSKPSLEWLTYMSYLTDTFIQHAKNGGEFRIPGTYYHVDGYDAINKVCWEFEGCYYHGCPTCFPDRSKINTKMKKTYEELLSNTRKKRDIILGKGYKFAAIWGCKWSSMVKQYGLEELYTRAILDKPEFVSDSLGDEILDDYDDLDDVHIKDDLDDVYIKDDLDDVCIRYFTDSSGNVYIDDLDD